MQTNTRIYVYLPLYLVCHTDYRYNGICRQTQGEIYVLLYMECVVGHTDLIIYADTSSNSNSLATALLIGSSRPT